MTAFEIYLCSQVNNLINAIMFLLIIVVVIGIGSLGVVFDECKKLTELNMDKEVNKDEISEVEAEVNKSVIILKRISVIIAVLVIALIVIPDKHALKLMLGSEKVTQTEKVMRFPYEG